MSKLCLKCNILKEDDEFTKSKHHKLGLHSWCKQCKSSWEKQYRIANPDRIKAIVKKTVEKNKEKLNEYKKNYRNRPEIKAYHKTYIKEYNKTYLNRADIKLRRENYRLNYNYGLTIDDKQKMIANQNGKCASCDLPFGSDPKNCCVDHDHTTDKVRKLLCKSCNTALGIMNENPLMILKLYNYSIYCESIKGLKNES